jgi:hypothetical protein
VSGYQFRILNTLRSSVHFRLADHRRHRGHATFSTSYRNWKIYREWPRLRLIFSGSQIASFSIFYSCDMTFGRTERAPSVERTSETALRQIDHRNTFLIGCPPGSLRELEGEKLTRAILRVRFRPEVSTQHCVTTCSAHRGGTGTSVRPCCGHISKR